MKTESTPCERRIKHNRALADAIEYCNRPGFGTPKYYRVVYDNNVVVCIGMFPRDGKTVRGWLENAKKDHIAYIEKEWPSGWEVCWEQGIGWI